MVTVQWKGQMVFEGVSDHGTPFLMDAHPESGGKGLGPTPLEAFQCSLAACSAMDVIIILQKKKQVVTSYRMEIEGERTPEGAFPRPFTSLTVRHYLKGENLDPAAVQRAVELSDEKYCSVAATLRANPTIASEWVIEE